MLSLEQLKDFHPLVVTPSHDGKFYRNYVISLLNFHQAAFDIGMQLQSYFMQGESLVTRARNNCVADFLHDLQYTHLFWIDADIGFSAEAALRLLQSDYDIAAGVYPLKTDSWPEEGLPTEMSYAEFHAYFQCYTINARARPDQQQLDFHILENGFMEMNEAPTGFMVIKRSVFEKMMQHYPELHYCPDTQGVVDQGLHYRFFDVMVDPETKRYLSEDYTFCRLWEDMGGKVYIDANSRLTHQGNKLYQGSVATSLKTDFSRVILSEQGLPMRLTGLDHLDEANVR